MRRKLILSIAAALCSSAATAQLTKVAVPGSVPPPAKVADLSWLAGEWTGEGFDSVLHENYSAPIGGQMPGHFYGAKDGKPDFYEFVMIAEVGNSIEYRVKHFNPDMTGWEEKAHFIRFPLVAVEEDAWYFDGLTIRRTGPDTADHVVRIKRKDGSEGEAVLKYWRAGSKK
ncbi:MAG TPA: DUF6265 family protein [Sphingomicrobium sp.]|mgnify:FL=1|nr:DUF6265 family protein [Sphingomicrobium sp.]